MSYRRNADRLFNKISWSEYEQFRFLTEQVFLPVLVVQNGMVKYANYAFFEITGIPEHKQKTISLKSLLFSIQNEALKYALANYQECHYGCCSQNPVRLITNSTVKWVELYCTHIEYNGLKADFITFFDVTRKINSEKEIRYLAYHDKLTGLYNRGFFEEEVQRIDVKRSLPISIIMADLNGLKLTNDVFGHFEGDKLLTAAAGLFRRVCRKEDIVARWGGDEFAVLLPETDNEAAARICERIEAECKAEKEAPIILSMSLGYSTKNSPGESLKDTLKLSENMMYRKKLTESREIRNNILSTIKESLFKRSVESEAHIKRVALLAKDFAWYLDLNEKELDELSLLSLIHDIGKVAIDDQILKKAGRLDKDEWAEVRTHAEKGYKIAVNHQELAHISDGILCHHERWDGMGYPQGLSEKDIPQISRILNIVDAYDIMTHNTVYKKAVSNREALDEINRCSGKQFDPFYANAFIEFIKNA